jgi:hypothetical protein
VVLGVVAAPGRPTEMARRVIADGLQSLLEQRLPGATWRIQVEQDRLVTPPASDAEIVDAARRLLLHRGWDVVVCLTDLPLRSRARRPVLAHTNPVHRVAVLCVPALGTRRRDRVQDLVVQLVEQLLGVNQNADGGAESVQDIAERVRELGTDVGEEPYAFTARVLTGNIRLLIGMVRDNQPWRLTLRLSRALAAAAAAGVFALVTSDIWRLADTFGAVRLTGATIGSLAAVAATLIIGAQLWERAPGRHNREQVVLFNIATTATVVIGVAAFYAVLLVLAGVAAACLVVPRGFSDALGHPVHVSDYAELAWLTCSLATLGGALGAGLETDDDVREAAYAQHNSTTTGDPDPE